MNILKQHIKLPVTSGKHTIARADDVFEYIDSDFEKWNTDVKSAKTKEMEVAICEIDTDMTFEQMFTHPDEMCLSQDQIIDFCRDCRSELRADGYATFFLFKVANEFFVANVHVRSDDRLNVHLHRLSRVNVWHAECGLRIVLPQLALTHFAPMTLSPSDTLTLRVEKLEQTVNDLLTTLRNI